MAVIPQSPSTDFTSTTLNGTINDSTLTITVNDASTIVTPTYAVIDREDNNGTATPNQREVTYISAKSGNDLTVTRGVDNSTARSHNDSAKVEPMITVGFWDDFYDAYDLDHNPADGGHDITKVAMLSGATVQILANKILSNPTITGIIGGAILSNPTIALGSLSSVIISSATIIQPTMTLLQGASVTPTVEGDIQWRTGDNVLSIGDGTNPTILQLGEWKSWTPTMTNGAVGNGTLTAKYSQIGKVVALKIQLALGSTSSIGTTPTFTVPVTATSTNGEYINTLIADADGGVFTGLALVINTTVTPYVDNTAGTYATRTGITASVPMTWTTNDNLLIDGIYEAD